MAKRGRPRNICAACNQELHMMARPVKSAKLNKKFCDLKCFQEYSKVLEKNDQNDNNSVNA